MATALATPGGATDTPSNEALVQRAVRLAPDLRDRGREGDKARRLPDSVVEDLLKAGLLQMLAPRRFGGSQASLHAFFQCAHAVAQGDGATAWILGILGCHHWVLSHFPIDTQEELYDGNTYALFPMTFSGKGGVARRVDGGFVVSGQWGFASGIDFSSWVGALAKVEDEDLAINFLAPIAEVEVIDTWFTAGMRGTGSRDFKATELFVPARRCVSQADMMSGRTPGAAALPEYKLLRAPFHSVLLIATIGPALGLAKRSIDDFVTFTKSRIGYGGMDHASRPSTHIRIANTMARYDAYFSRIRDQFAELDAIATAGEKFSAEQRLRYRRDVCLAAAECARIVDDVVGAAGARAQHETSPFQLIQRDINTIRTHVILDQDDANELYGRHALGLELGPTRY